MKFMFSWCSSLISIDISKFNTQNVSDMCEMFNNCKSLTSIYVSNSNIDKIKKIVNEKLLKLK